jgi:hypothetical protein
MSTQGTLLNMVFIDSTSDFFASFKVDTTIIQPTVAYLNAKYWYYYGLRITISTGKQILLESSDYTID